MIPFEYENLKIWLRHWNRVTAGLEKEAEVENSSGLINKSFVAGARFAIKQVAKHYACSVRLYRRRKGYESTISK